MKYDKNKNVNLLLDPILIKYLPGGKKILHSLISPSNKEWNCSYACKFVARHCANVSSKIKDVFNQSYSPMAPY